MEIKQPVSADADTTSNEPEEITFSGGLTFNLFKKDDDGE